MKTIILFVFLAVSLFARYDAIPSKECPAFNNMKHSKNTHNIVLNTARSYTVLKHHKGQNLILIKGESPAQRWVDERCFSSAKKAHKSQKHSIERELPIASINTSKSKHTNKYKNNNSKKYDNANTSKQNLLALSWHNAFCETHRYKKECKRSFASLMRSKPREKSFVLHGLWPQPRNNLYCHVDRALVNADKNKHWREMPSLALDADVEDALKKYMPGFASGLHKHEWIKHGTCYGTDANAYFSDAISLVKQVNDSALGAFFTQNIGNVVTLKEVQNVSDKAFGQGTGRRVELQCKGGLITELWLHLGSGSKDLGTLLKNGKNAYSRCKKGRIDRAGF